MLSPATMRFSQAGHVVDHVSVATAAAVAAACLTAFFIPVRLAGVFRARDVVLIVLSLAIVHHKLGLVHGRKASGGCRFCRILQLLFLALFAGAFAA